MKKIILTTCLGISMIFSPVYAGAGDVNLIAKIAPFNDGFVGIVDAEQVIAGALGIGDYTITGHATTTLSFHAPEICLDNNCMTTWPSGGGGGAEALGNLSDVATTTAVLGDILVLQSDGTYDNKATSTLNIAYGDVVGTPDTFENLYNATTTLNGFTNNSSNWNTAYGWGDWSTQGFITNISGFNTTDLSEGTNLYYTDARVADYINASSTMPVGDWNTAYGWGDHSSAGYYLASSYDTDWATQYNATTTLNGFTPSDYLLTSNFSSSFDTDFSGKLTSDLSEGTNLYYTDARVNDLLNASSTVATYTDFDTEAEFESLLFSVFTPNDGALADDDLSNNDLDSLQNVAAMTEASGDILYYNTSWTKLAKGLDGEVLKLASGLPAWGTDNSGSGSGSGNVATSTIETSGQVPYWTSTAGTPATLGSDAGMSYDATLNRLTLTNVSTTDITVSGSISDYFGVACGTTNQFMTDIADDGTFSCTAIDTSGTWSGNAGTATVLASNGANCTTGNAPLGVDASGAVESCFDVWTEAENTSAGYISNISGFSTTDLSEGTNLYWTQARWDTAYNATTTLNGFTPGDYLLTSNFQSSYDSAHIATSTTPGDWLVGGNATTTAFYSPTIRTDEITNFFGVDCSNQFLRGIAADGTFTCSTVDISADTNLAVSGTLLDLTGSTLSINEGTLTNTYLCTYETASGLVCNTNPSSIGSGEPNLIATSTDKIGTLLTGSWVTPSSTSSLYAPLDFRNDGNATTTGSFHFTELIDSNNNSVSSIGQPTYATSTIQRTALSTGLDIISFDIPANELKSSNGVKVKVTAEYKHPNDASDITYGYKIKFNGNIVSQCTRSGGSANNIVVTIDCEATILNRTSSSQVYMGSSTIFQAQLFPYYTVARTEGELSVDTTLAVTVEVEQSYSTDANPPTVNQVNAIVEYIWAE